MLHNRGRSDRRWRSSPQDRAEGRLALAGLPSEVGLLLAVELIVDVLPRGVFVTARAVGLR
jgi:hypothetical protein